MKTNNQSFFSESNRALLEQTGIESHAERVDWRDKRKTVSEMDRSVAYWQNRLEGETRIEQLMDSRCEFAIIIPVFNERPDRILRQIDSFKRQEGVDPSQFELIYIVNNDTDDGSARFHEIYENNSSVIRLLRRDHGLKIHVIDKSSQGNGIPECNVGKARNRGVAEASLRFHEQKRNGTLIQTDADTYIEDKQYLARLKEIIDNDPDVIGIAGGLIREWSPDTQSESDRRILRKKLDVMIRERIWDSAAEFLRDTNARQVRSDDNFSGAHMISRSLESAIIGGLIDANFGEDPQFGEDLKNYANGRGQKVIGMKNDLKVVTALRESDRTGASYKKKFNEIDLEHPRLVPDVLAEDISTFRDGFLEKFRRVFNDRDGLRSLMTTPDGTRVMDDAAIEEFLSYTANKKELDFSDSYYQDFSLRHFAGENADPTLRIYNATYPPVPLTEGELKRVLDHVQQMEGWADFAASVRAWQTVRIADEQTAI